jgi:hypothetical protein
MEEFNPPSVEDLVFISDNIYRKEQILDMELEVCEALKFHLQHVTPMHHAHEYMLASQQGTCFRIPGPAFHCILRNMVHYLLELARIPYELMAVKPSLLAAAALYLARATLGIRDPTSSSNPEGSAKFWTRTLQCYTGYSVDGLRETVRIIHQYHQDAESSSLKAVFIKYGRSKFMQVSHKTVLREEELE